MRAGIRAGTYRAGHRLREAEIAAALNTSRAPVREAIRRLEADRLVEDVAGAGLTVRPLDRQRVLELYMVRAAMEGTAAEWAAMHATELDIAELSDTLSQVRTVPENSECAARLYRRFHEGIYRAARNSFLDHVIASTSDFMALLPGTTHDLPGRAAQVLREHEQVLLAIAARDPERAARAMRDHIQMASQLRLRMTPP
ncbi:MAG: GntR family transcriptional regulator [Roseomonas sp.]|nr:GntR family transcriptional regulator [Roseomonas sp.]